MSDLWAHTWAGFVGIMGVIVAGVGLALALVTAAGAVPSICKDYRAYADRGATLTWWSAFLFMVVVVVLCIALMAFGIALVRYAWA